MGQARMNVVFCSAILVMCWTSAFALDPSLDASQYAHSSWKVSDGFSKGTVATIAQTPDGYLWLGTEFGVVRFDGVRSVPWQPPDGAQLPDHYIICLLAARDGTLWIGTFKGIASWKDGKLTQYPALAGMEIAALLEDRQGTIWVGGRVPGVPPGRLCAIKNGTANCYGADGSVGRKVVSLHEDTQGNLWVGASNRLVRWSPGPPQVYPTPERVLGVTEGENGSLLIAMASGIKQLTDGKLIAYPLQGLGSFSPTHLLRDQDGGLWIGTSGNGLLHVHQGKTDAFAHADGLSGDDISELFQDREGNFWVATNSGLDRFRDYAVPAITVKQGLSSAIASSVLAARDGSVWFGTPKGLNRWKDGRITVYRKPREPSVDLRERALEIADPGLPTDHIGSLFENNDGRIWISTDGGIAYFENGRFIPVSTIPRDVQSITTDGAGNLWMADAAQGLLHVRGRNIDRQISWTEVGRKDNAEVLLSDPAEGGLWLGFYAGGVGYFKNGQLREFFPSANSSNNGVNDLRREQDGTLWAATDGGLTRIKDGRVATLTSENGLPCDPVNWAMEDDDHSVWLYMACGLVRIPRADLDAWAGDPKRKIQATVFGNSDGVSSHETEGSRSPTVAKTADGKLWFRTPDGPRVLDPRHLPFNKLPPPVHIEQITADDKTYEATNGLRLPTHVRNLQIDYTALSLVVPEKVHFRYKLEGQNRNWHEVINERKVQYTNLAPGNYRFRVVACNNSGVWNEEGATLDFVIPPAWYQTNWFRAGCVAAFLAMIWGIHELRVRQVAHQYNMRIEERVSERTRIARDLHDTLLQSFQGLVFRFQAVRYQLPDRPEEASDALDNALVSADQALAEGRSAIQELRSDPFKESNLEQLLLATGRELASSQDGGHSAPPLRVIVEGQRRAKRVLIKEEIYRIARELLRNAYRHAHARRIEAELRYDEDAFLLVIRDDGKGIDPKILKNRGRPGHWGLPGMFERAEGIGAQLDIWSEAGAGTEVRLTVPAAIVYEKPREEGRFNLFRKTRGS